MNRFTQGFWRNSPIDSKMHTSELLKPICDNYVEQNDSRTLLRMHVHRGLPRRLVNHGPNVGHHMFEPKTEWTNRKHCECLNTLNIWSSSQSHMADVWRSTTELTERILIIFASKESWDRVLSQYIWVYGTNRKQWSRKPPRKKSIFFFRVCS